MEYTELAKTINTINIKRSNGINTDKEEEVIIEAFSELADLFSDEMEYEESDALKERTKGFESISEHPYIACKEMVPLYRELYKETKTAFCDWKDNKENPDKKNAFFAAFDLLYEYFSFYLGDKLLKYGNWEPEQPFADIKLEDIPEYGLYHFVSMDDFNVLFGLFDIINNHIDDALDNHNKGECMMLYPIINHLLNTMSYLIDLAKIE